MPLAMILTNQQISLQSIVQGQGESTNYNNFDILNWLHKQNEGKNRNIKQITITSPYLDICFASSISVAPAPGTNLPSCNLSENITKTVVKINAIIWHILSIRYKIFKIIISYSYPFNKNNNILLRRK